MGHKSWDSGHKESWRTLDKKSLPIAAAFTNDSRFITLDAVRGLSVLAILWINILSFAMPDAALLSPRFIPFSSPANDGVWLTNFIFADGKFRGLFTLLLGASMVLVMERANRSSQNPASVHARRMAWLLVIGLAHYLLLWHGDILISYALMGLLLTGLYQRSAAELLRWGICGLIAGAIWMTWLGAGRIEGLAHMLGLASTPAAVDAVRQMHLADWAQTSLSFRDDLSLFQGSYGQILAGRLDKLINSLLALPIIALETLPMMLIGMGLYRNRFLIGGWPFSAYFRLFCWTLPFGLLLSALPAAYIAANAYDPMLALTAHLGLSVPGRLLLILAYAAGAIMLILLYPAHPWTLRLAAAGRMALSNYLASSLIMSSIFYGYGGGLYGRMGWIGLYGCAAATSLILLLWSPWWMARYAYGPVEWLWRSLARGSWQTMRR